MISAGWQLPARAKSPIARAAIWAVLVAFVSVVAGGWSFGHHLEALGLACAIVAGLSLVALVGLGLTAAVMFASRREPLRPNRDRR